jgi:PAS domain S-box-containing protein
MPADSAPPGSETDVADEVASTLDAESERWRRSAAEHAAMRRVASLVAEGVSLGELFLAVAFELAELLGGPVVTLNRYGPDGMSTVLASNDPDFPVGSSRPPEEGTLAARVRASGLPERVDDYSSRGGEVADAAEAASITSSVGVPIVVNGAVWGVVCLARKHAGVLPRDTEARLPQFVDLVRTAISAAQARDDLRALADEQAALRRLATLVALGTDSQQVFDAVCAETGRLLDAASVNLARFSSDGLYVVVAGWSVRDTHLPTGFRCPLADDAIGGVIHRSRAPARMEAVADGESELARVTRRRGIRSEVGAPVVVEGRIWGALVAGKDVEQPFPVGAESRVARLTDIAAAAVSNAATRAELVASRARIVATGDAVRRRIERNLHDGTQQRLLALGLDLATLETLVPAGGGQVLDGLERIRGEVDSILEDVRELSRGLHPALLARAGLRTALSALVRRSPIAVDLQVDVARRPAEPIEVGIYYVVAEALANVVKHARASAVTIRVTVTDSVARAMIEDDGVGGARAVDGSGLAGLTDRIEALGGRLEVESPPAGGTRVAVQLPLEFAAAAEPIAAVDSVFALQTYLADVVAAGRVLQGASPGDAVCIVDDRGRIASIDRDGLRILGYGVDELNGLPAHDAIHYLRPDGEPAHAVDSRLLRPAVTGEAVDVAEDWFVRKDGSFVAVSYRSAPLPLRGGRGLVVTFRERPTD